jgi:predicted transcriptional regulator of viral defense system
MRSASLYIDELAARGRHHFTTQDARVALGVPLPAVRASLRRLQHRGAIADPHRGFYVIVPPEYRRLGCLPPEQFIHELMAHLGQTYYVALLSAAELHGAAHHRPQTFQVMVAKQRREIVCGDVRVQFVMRRDLEKTPIVEMNTPRGRLRVSSPEATALELVGYAEQCGGLDNVGSVLSELGEVLSAEKLIEAAQLCPVAWMQRLGYLFELVEQDALANALEAHVRERAVVYAPLIRAQSTAHAKRLERWKLAVNASVEPER